MNYRQWKKNYKKVNGYNPPLEIDRRKQIKRAARLISSIDLTYFFESISETMGMVFEYISDMFSRMAKIFRG